METPQNIGLFEDDRAKRYDTFVQDWIPNYTVFTQMLPPLLAHTIPKPLLVVGCGTGSEMLACKQHHADWPMTGIDLSPQMITQAQEKLKDHTQVVLLEGEVATLPTDVVFGAATLILVLHFVKDDGSKLALLQGIANRLEPGAPFILKDIFGAPKLLEANLDIWCNTLPTHLPLEEKEERKVRIAEKLHHIPEQRLSDLLQEAGFKPPTRFYQNTIYGAWMTTKA